MNSNGSLNWDLHQFELGDLEGDLKETLMLLGVIICHRMKTDIIELGQTTKNITFLSQQMELKRYNQGLLREFQKPSQRRYRYDFTDIYFLGT